METTCMYENFLMGLLVIPAAFTLFPLLMKYVISPLYHWLGEWCLNPEWGIFLIATCWIGWSAKLLAWICDLVPPVVWGVLCTLGIIITEIEAKHVFHTIISILLGVGMFVVAFVFIFSKDDSKKENNNFEEE